MAILMTEGKRFAFLWILIYLDLIQVIIEIFYAEDVVVVHMKKLLLSLALVGDYNQYIIMSLLLSSFAIVFLFSLMSIFLNSWISVC